MKNRWFLFLGGLLIVFIFCLLYVSAEKDIIKSNYARDPPVHQYLGYQAYLLLNDEMKEEFDEYIGSPVECVETFCGLENEGKSITEGAYEEDQFGMWMYHFWDPDTGNGLYWMGKDYKSAYDRAQELWNESLEEYSNGNEENAYYLLGRVMHLLSDMSVPAHVHLDPHGLAKDSYENYMSLHYKEYTMDSLPSWEPANLFEIFYWLAESADDFDSDDECGEITNCWMNSWCVSGKNCGIIEKDCKFIGEYMIPRTIVRIGGLYKLFWKETEHSKEYKIEVKSPEDKIYDVRNINFKIESNFKLDKIFYEEGGKERLLCKRCQNYSHKKIFNEGFHKIVVKGIKSKKVVFEKELNFFVDSKKSRIYSIEPNKGFANGVFKISFKEDFPVQLTLNYAGEKQKLELEDCYEKSGKTYCGIQVDLKKFDGESVIYWFELEDKSGNVKKSKKIKIDVDLSKPVIENLNYEINGRRVNFKIKIDEKNLDDVRYSEGRVWKILCSRLKNRFCESKKIFGYGNHNLKIRVLDDAGNYVEEYIEFEIKKT